VTTTTTVSPGKIVRPQGGGPQPVLEEDDLDLMIEMSKQGKTLGEIGAVLHVHPTTAGRYLRGVGIYVTPIHRSRALNSEAVMRTCELSSVGYSARDIAQIMDVHPTTIRHRLRKHARDDSWRYRPNRLPDNGRWPKRA